MKIKLSSVIEFPTKKPSSGRGAFGRYYKVNEKMGVKVLNTNVQSLRSGAVKKAASEIAALQMCEDSGYSPKVFGFVILRRKVNHANGKHSFRNQIGIVMEHINGKCLEEYEDENYDLAVCAEDVNDEIGFSLEDCGINLCDWHDGNVMVRSTYGAKSIRGMSKNLLKNIVRIDFGDGFFSVDSGFGDVYRKKLSLNKKKILKVLGKILN